MDLLTRFVTAWLTTASVIAHTHMAFAMVQVHDTIIEGAFYQNFFQWELDDT